MSTTEAAATSGTHTSRRTLVGGALWAMPVVVSTAAIPAYAASLCRTITMSWGATQSPKIANPTVITITGGSQTVYATVTYTVCA